jgi:hypothetical protein
MNKESLIEHIELILKANKNNKYCDVQQLKSLLTEVIKGNDNE